MENIWLKSYPAGVPSEINPDLYPSIIDMMDDSCEKHHQSTAFSNLGTQLSFAQLQQLSINFAAFLQQELKLQAGERVALMLPNTLQYPVAMLGILRAGLIIVNVNPLYTARELEHQLVDSGAKAIIVMTNFASVVQEVLPKCQLEHVIVTQMGDLLPLVKRCLVNFVVKQVKKMVPAWSIPKAVSLLSGLKQGKNLTLLPVKLTGENIAFLQYTGGTTGVAKGAILTHRNIMANIQQASVWIRSVVKDNNELIVTALPLYHIFSLLANCLTFMWLGIPNLLITNPRDISGFVKELAKSNFTIITGVNTLFNALLNNPDFRKIDFSNFHFALGGGMAVQESVAKRWQNVVGKPIHQAYGLTETSPAACINPLNLKEFNSSVGLPISSTLVMIRDELGQALPCNQPGELCIKGPQVTQGYWNMPAETAKIFTEDGWLLTGDIAKIDEKGFVTIVDRKKDMIIVSGFNVYPNEIEEVIAAHPGVQEVAVIGVITDDGSEKIKAFIVSKDLALAELDIIEHCRNNLTAYKVPKLIEFRQELPKSNVGKVLRRLLRDEYKP